MRDKIAQLEARNSELEQEKEQAQGSGQRRRKGPAKDEPMIAYIGTPSEPGSQAASSSSAAAAPTQLLEGIAATLESLQSRMTRMEATKEKDAVSDASWHQTGEGPP